MTLLVSWIGIDSRAPASIYVASDSRISWDQKNKYDFGKKVFACNEYPEIFGYCGDVLFPVMMLSQVVDSIDRRLLFREDMVCREKSQIVMQRMIDSFRCYPNEVNSITSSTFEILHCSRDKDQHFHCNKIKWDRNNHEKMWSLEEKTAESFSDKLFVLGSGREEFLEKYKKYLESENGKTSRSLFQCLCHTIDDIKDAYCGGAPQLAGIYRKTDTNGRLYGIISNRKRFFEGMRIDNYPKENLNNIEWRNELFEICDGVTMQRRKDAQRQPNPVRDEEATPHAAQ